MNKDKKTKKEERLIKSQHETPNKIIWIVPILIFVIAGVLYYYLHIYLPQTQANIFHLPQVKTQQPIIEEPIVIEDPRESIPREEMIHIEYERVNFDGSFTLSSNTVISKDEIAVEPFTMTMFTDPFCPGCFTFKEDLMDIIIDYMEGGHLALEIRPVIFMASADSNFYSYRAAAILIGIAEFAPEYTLDFLKAIFDLNWAISILPDMANEDIFELARIVGVNEEVLDKIKENIEDFKDMAFIGNDEFMNPEISIAREKSTIERPFTPFVLINNTGEFTEMALDFPNGNHIDLTIDRLKELIGH